MDRREGKSGVEERRSGEERSGAGLGRVRVSDQTAGTENKHSAPPVHFSTIYRDTSNTAERRVSACVCVCVCVCVCFKLHDLTLSFLVCIVVVCVYETKCVFQTLTLPLPWCVFC